MDGSLFGELTDLWYPSAKKREELNRRRIRLNEEYPDAYINDLMAQNVASMICRRNPQNVMKLFYEGCPDREIADYRLDAIEDMMANPTLSPTLHKAVRTLLEGEHRGLSKMNSPDSFSSLSVCIESLDMYIDCMESLHSLYDNVRPKLRSAAFISLMEDFEARYRSEDFAGMRRDISELKKAFSEKIRSVTVAINFNAEMRPIAAGVVGWSDKPAGEKPSIFDRLFYKNSAHPDIYVLGRLRTDRPNEDGFVNEADRALFESMEKLTSAYIAGLERALRAYDRLSAKNASMIEDRLDIYDGVIRITEAAQARGLKMCRPAFSEKKGYAKIEGVFDPCFFFKAAAADTEAHGDGLVVRNDITMDDTGRFFILTGANNGGKTTFVRAVGLCFLLAKTGFYVPAEKCELSICDHIFTHFPKEEETGINASRFTTEIKDIKRITELITENSLLLMNESIQSTTPKECEEIASELVRIFCIMGVRGIYATHITELAQKCAEIAADPDCRSVPVSIVAGIDSESGKRLYRITRGEPAGHSYAADIFRSFGISADEIRLKMHRREKL